jgi:hypothetical protein
LSLSFSFKLEIPVGICIILVFPEYKTKKNILDTYR